MKPSSRGPGNSLIFPDLEMLRSSQNSSFKLAMEELQASFRNSSELPARR
jgi:hypothetical protein